MEGEHVSSHVWLHAEWHLAPLLAGYSWPRKESSTHLNLCIRTITQLKDKVLDKYGQNGLSDAISAPVSNRYGFETMAYLELGDRKVFP